MTSDRKVVVITGASRGIGAQLSKAYRQIGYQVIASSRSMRKSDDPAIQVIEGDITRPETAERILGMAVERFDMGLGTSERLRSLGLYRQSGVGPCSPQPGVQKH